LGLRRDQKLSQVTLKIRETPQFKEMRIHLVEMKRIHSSSS
jgi:hypothetical protein